MSRKGPHISFPSCQHWVHDEDVNKRRFEVAPFIERNAQGRLVWFIFTFIPDSKPTEDGEVFEGNQRLEGYSLDLIDAISKILKFNYQFELVPDSKLQILYIFL